MLNKITGEINTIRSIMTQLERSYKKYGYNISDVNVIQTLLKYTTGLYNKELSEVKSKLQSVKTMTNTIKQLLKGCKAYRFTSTENLLTIQSSIESLHIVNTSSKLDNDTYITWILFDDISKKEEVEMLINQFDVSLMEYHDTIDIELFESDIITVYKPITKL